MISGRQYATGIIDKTPIMFERKHKEHTYKINPLEEPWC